MFLNADIASCRWLILTEQHRTLLYFIIISQWELSFELSQLPSSWLVLYILFFYLYSVPRLSFRRSFFSLFSTATNSPFCPSFLCPHLALFQPLAATICMSQLAALICREGCEIQGWEGSRQQCISASDPESV